MSAERSMRRLSTRGVTVNIRVEGSGPPLLFLGGSHFDLSVKASVFNSALVKHFTVAAADPRGLGLTDAPAGDWSMHDYAQDALDVLDALNWGTSLVLGESFGAMTALHLAHLAPDRIDKLALAAASPGGAGGSSYPIEEFLSITDPMEKAIAVLSILDTRFTDEESTHAKQRAEMIAERMAFDTAFFASHDNARGYRRLLAARATHDSWDFLPGIAIPTWIFAGQYDAQAPLSRARALSTALPDARLRVIPAGHNLCFGSEEPVQTLLRDWQSAG